MKSIVKLPLDIPCHMRKIFEKNYQMLTRDTGSLFLMAADQKIEHLLIDFYGDTIPQEVLDPEHLFHIARAGHIGCIAAPLGLIARYGIPQDNINYIIKINGKTNLVPTTQADPLSRSFYSIEDIVNFTANSSLKICGIGYTVYLGGEHESLMLQEAATLAYKAHQYGLIVILWMYPRGQAIKRERSGELIAGAAGVALCLGADFVKINMPEDDEKHTGMEWLTIAQQAAGTTQVICSGGARQDSRQFIKQVHEELTRGIAGCAIGRNIYQYERAQAVAITCALGKLIYEKCSLDDALAELEKSPAPET